MDFEDLVGSCLVFGIPGTRITSDIVRHFQETRAGGLILYRINFESPPQIIQLVRDLEEALQRRLLVTVDHEGGRVVMFREGVTVFPDNLAFGTIDAEEGAREQGAIEARELRRLGMDVNFSPTIDVLTETYSPNIGIRSYGRDPRQVGRLGAARIRAMQAGGLSATAKHFPGLGPASLDPHLKLPVIRTTWEEMDTVHLVPFLAAMEAGVDVIMSSHPLYPLLDSAPGTPATFSRPIIRGCLRDRLGYQGVISSDDLEMGAVGELCPIGEAAVRTAAAGHDLLLSCHDNASQRQVFDTLTRAYRGKSLSLSDLEASVQRIEALKAKRPQRFVPGNPAADPVGTELARSVSQRAAVVLKDKNRLLPLSPARAGRVLTVFPALGSLASRIMIERVLEEEAKFLEGCFSRYGVNPGAVILPIEPSDAEIKTVADQAARFDTTILFCYDAHMVPPHKKLLEGLTKGARKLVVVLMRDPYDIEFIAESTACVTAYGYRVCQLEAAIGKIFS
jgi:beta-N-acetylhexosaminidase